MNSEFVPVEPAATSMILREVPEGLQVLMLKRNDQLRFAPGYWVFPGGRVDAQEQQSTSSAYEAARLAAVRETREECGLRIAVENLHEYYRWTTPSGGSRRYGTWFFHTLLPRREHKIIIDEEEIVDFKWKTPQEALTDMNIGKMPLLPPTLVSLWRIRRCVEYEEVCEEFKRTGSMDVEPVVVRKEHTFYSLYPGDAGYQTKDINQPGDRHRLIIRLRPVSYRFEYSGSPGFPSIIGERTMGSSLAKGLPEY